MSISLPILKVTTGIIVKDNKFFVGKRAPGHSMSSKWEFPGGKIEKHETPEDCVVRELHEELGVNTKILAKLGVLHHCYEDFEIELHVFLVELLDNSPLPFSNEHVDFGFRYFSEILELPWDACDIQIMPLLKKFLSEKMQKNI